MAKTEKMNEMKWKRTADESWDDRNREKKRDTSNCTQTQNKVEKSKINTQTDKNQAKKD